MKALLATLLAAVVLLALTPVAFGMPRGPHGPMHSIPPATQTTDSSSGGTEWYVYALAGLGGVIVVGGVSYAVYVTHRHAPHRPVGVH